MVKEIKKTGKIQNTRLWCLLLLFFLSGISLGIAFIVPPVWKLKNGPIEVLRWPKSGPRYYNIGPGQAYWTNISDVSKHVIHAIVIAEDARFYEHFGLDFIEIKSSILFNLEKKRFARGASTISQQVVKMSFLDSEKNVFRKLREALGAILLEALLDKDEILAWYINLVEFGDGVFGIKAASEHFFQTSPELLTIQNGTQLAMILPSPNVWGKSLREKELSDLGQKRYANIITEMQKQGFITSALKDAAMATGNFGKPIEVPPFNKSGQLDEIESELTSPPEGDSDVQAAQDMQVRLDQTKSKKL